MDFATLKAAVNSAMGRSDVPDYVYTLTTAGVNRDCRFLDMQGSATVSTSSNPATLPSDFGSMVSAYIDYGGINYPVRSTTDSAARIHAEDRIPHLYAIQDGAILFSPDPDGTYTVNIQYIKRLDAFAADSDTNDVIARYPDLYLYQALTHAAIWAKDAESERSYGSAYVAALKAARKDDMRRRNSQGIQSRNRRL